MKWAGHVACMGEDRGVYRVWWEKKKKKGYWGDQDIDGSIRLRWIIRKLRGRFS
jgi:hypothetical protein